MAKRSGKFYRKNEREVMEQLGLKPTKNSGSGWVEKEDGENEFILAQLKSTDANSIRVDRADIKVLEYNATIAHKVPIFVIQFLQTNEVFIQVRPEDIPFVAEYINTGQCKLPKPIISIQEGQAETPKSIIKSSQSAREEFHKERERKFKNVKTY